MLMLMLQLVPTIPPDPAAAPDVATVVSGIMDQIIAAAAPQVQATGMAMWRGLAAILVAWTGLRIAFTGDFRPWDLVRIVIALWFPWAMLSFYNTPLPGSTLSFTAAITEGGNWLQGVLIANTGEDYLVSFTRLSQNFFARASSMELGSGSGMLDIVLNGLTNLSYLFMAFLHTIIFELFLLLILLCLVVIYAVSMGQVIWAQLALGVLLILGPLFIPFLLVEPLAFLFWGWFKGMFTYTLYGAIAAALMRVFLAASMGWIEAIMNGPPPGNSFWWHSTAWFLSIVPLVTAGLLSSLMIGTLASQIVSGGGAGGGIMGLVGQAASGDFQTQNWRERYKRHGKTQRQRIRCQPGIRGNMGRDDPLEPSPARVHHRPRRHCSCTPYRRPGAAVIGRAAAADCRSGGRSRPGRGSGL